MKFLLRLFLPLFPVFAFVIEYQPWFGNVYEFNFLSRYAYSYFSSVNSSLKPLGSTSHDHLLYFDLEFPSSSVFSMDADIEFTRTPRQTFSFRSCALQARYSFFDDNIGDTISLAVGGNIRYTSSKSLRDISCPYYANCDFEGTVALGKEFSKDDYWRIRMWGTGGIGIGNRGSPYFLGICALEGMLREESKWGIFAIGTHGYGRKTYVDIDHFYGYANIREKSVDIAGRYGHRLGVWGTLSFEYRRRVYAKCCPKDVNTFAINYLLPFSF